MIPSAVIIIPAIDIRGGRCVRLIQGDYGRETVYEQDPAAMVEKLHDRGVSYLHVVNLDAARSAGDPESDEAARRVLDVAGRRGITVEIGGGIRDDETATRWLDAGASYVVLGSVALRHPDTAKRICQAAPGRCLLSLDVRGDTALAEGWTQSAGSADDHVDLWRDWPTAGLIRTNVAHDGMLGGPDLEGLRQVIERFPGPVFASGGISTVDDVGRCAEAGAAGVIVGRAIYEGSFDLKAALIRFPAGASIR
jgi:phosphoribosylformimino-5-aminoimidazole carboxamide ribotide isomerase